MSKPALDEKELQMVTELAFAYLFRRARERGLPLERCAGLKYLPDQEATRLFEQGCRAALESLR